MKIIITIALLSMGFLAIAQSGTIKVIIPGVKESKGKIQLCLYNSEDSFLDNKTVYKTATIAAHVSDSGYTYTFQSIEAGSYAILAYWDANDDGELNTNLIGIPKEEVGFSHNVLGSFGPPSFDDASFEVLENGIINLVINIKKPSHF